jgi:hypothetical protein
MWFAMMNFLKTSCPDCWQRYWRWQFHFCDFHVKDTQVSEPIFGQSAGYLNLRIHPETACKPFPCPFHNPSAHHMVDWKINVRLDNQGLVERICKCGVGHPDPDSIAYFERQGITHMSVHGCCGHCTSSTTVN